MTPAELLSAELLASATATAVLEQRCVALRLADPPRLYAEVERGRAVAHQSPSRTRLKVAKDEVLGYRRVRLMCGAAVLSEAINWYVPGRLTAEMVATLDASDSPFGQVILPLCPRRRTLSVWIAKPGHIPPGGDVVRHRALVSSGDGQPLAEVVERYKRILID